MLHLRLREVTEADLPHLFAHQRDPEASRMAAVPSRSLEAFMTHWHDKVLGVETALARTVEVDGLVVGHVVAWDWNGRRMIGYWLDRAVWGRGVATEALRRFLAEETARPLHADVAEHNLGSARVLEKCGFRRVGGLALGGDGISDYSFRLDD